MFCQKCGTQNDDNAVNCINCGESLNTQQNVQPAAQPVINIVNTNANTNTNVNGGGVGNPKNKWVAFVLCLLLGVVGGHKFYEGKVGMGILYIFTFGLFGIGILVDLISILTRPNPYYVSY